MVFDDALILSPHLIERQHAIPLILRGAVWWITQDHVYRLVWDSLHTCDTVLVVYDIGLYAVHPLTGIKKATQQSGSYISRDDANSFTAAPACQLTFQLVNHRFMVLHFITYFRKIHPRQGATPYAVLLDAGFG